MAKNNFFQGLWEWIKAFFYAHVKYSKNLIEGKTKLLIAFQVLGVGCVIVGGSTSLAYLAPTIQSYVEGWFGAGYLANTLSVIAIMVSSWIIDFSAIITVPFAVDFLGAILTLGSAPKSTDNALQKSFKKHARSWYGILDYIWGILTLKVKYLFSVGILMYAIGQSAYSMYLTFNGNGYAIADITSDIRPDSTGAKIMTLEEERRAKKASVESTYGSKIAAAEKTAIEEKQKAEIEADRIIAATKDNAWAKFGAALSGGDESVRRKYNAMIVEGNKKAEETRKNYSSEVEFYKEQKRTELATIDTTFSHAKASLLSDTGHKTELYQGIKNGMSMWAQYFGVFATGLLWLATILAAFIKYIDFQGIAKAVSVATTNSTTILTTHPTGNATGGGGVNTGGGGGNLTEAQIRRSITDNFSHSKQPNRNHKTISSNILESYNDYWELRFDFWKTGGFADAEAEGKADGDTQGFIADLVSKYGKNADPNFLGAVKDGYEKLDVK